MTNFIIALIISLGLSFESQMPLSNPFNSENDHLEQTDPSDPDPNDEDPDIVITDLLEG